MMGKPNSKREKAGGSEMRHRTRKYLSEKFPGITSKGRERKDQRGQYFGILCKRLNSGKGPETFA